MRESIRKRFHSKLLQATNAVENLTTKLRSCELGEDPQGDLEALEDVLDSLRMAIDAANDIGQPDRGDEWI